MKRFVFAIALSLIPSFALGEIETARDLMDAHNYPAALKELLPAARSGNAEAEELIGVMYAMGLGVARDDVRAFEWYLRAAMKGHPGRNRVSVGITRWGAACQRRTLSGPICGTSCPRSGVTLTRLFPEKKW